jgi:hypothetical protein
MRSLKGIRRPAARPVWGGREIVKVAAQFESIRMLDPADRH